MSKHKTHERQRVRLADQLRKAVKDSDKTVNAIAVEAGIPQPVLHRFAKGERDLTLATADKLARNFGLELRAGGDRSSTNEKASLRLGPRLE